MPIRITLADVARFLSVARRARGLPCDAPRMGIEPENVEQVKALAAEGCKVAAAEPGTLGYDWHYSQEQGCLVLLEFYADSDAHLAHMQADGHGELMGGLMALIDSVEFVVLGEPTPEHAAALSSVPGAQFYSEVSSI